jgi:hypothetical protein
MHPEYENVYGIRNEYDHYTVNRDSMMALRSKQRSHSKSFVLGNDTSTNSRSSDKFSKEQMHRAEQVKIMHNSLQHISDDMVKCQVTEKFTSSHKAMESYHP